MLTLTAVPTSWSSLVPGDNSVPPSPQGLVLDIYYQGTKAELQRCVGPDGLVPLVSGVVFFSVETAEHLLATHVSPPLDACTYMGLDSGAQPVQVTKGGSRDPLAWGEGKGASERLSDPGPVLSPFCVSLSEDGTSLAQPWDCGAQLLPCQ